MKLPALIVTDLHLVESPSTEYRWGLFPWLAEQIREERVKTLLILGDLTDAKDNHGAALVNRIVRAFQSLPADLVIRILAGNHDWLKAGEEFFRFLDVLPNVKFITRSWEDDDVSGPSAYFLPYSKHPARDWQGMDFSHYDYLFMHQTVKGAKSSNGQEMEGEELPELNARKVYSGDIHVPQVIGKVEYVGSPYHVHMGDAFKPRCVLLERDGNPVNLYFKTISRVTVTVSGLAELKRLAFKPGDQVKLRVELAEADKHAWSRIRREASQMLRDAKVEVHGIELIVKASTRRMLNEVSQTKALSPEDSVLKFVDDEELGGEALAAALEVIES